MNLPSIPWKTIGASLTKHAPSILTGVGISGFVTATVMAARATEDYKIDRETERCTISKDEYGNRVLGDPHPIPVKTEALIFAKHYWPTILVIGGSATCALLANRLNLQRQAALAAACSISETALKNYKSKTEELLSAKERERIEHEVHQDLLNEHKDEILSDRGLYPIEMQVILDDYSGTKFYLTEEDIRQAVNEFNAELICDGTKSYEELWSKLYERSANQRNIVRPKSVYAACFTLDSKKDLVEAHFDHGTVDNVPVSIVTFRPEPKVEQSMFY